MRFASIALTVLAFAAVMAAVMFGSAGRVDLPWVWATIAVCGVMMGAIAGSIDPELRRERFRPGPGGEDRLFRLKVLPVMLGMWVVAGLDLRFGWSHVPAWAHALGLLLLAAGLVLAWWSMRANRFFSPVLRVQSERGHHVIDGGPYRWVRHPGYAGSVLCAAASAPALGSWWVLVPAAVYAVAFGRRAVREERMLRNELDGYEAYTQRVTSRMVPGVW